MKTEQAAALLPTTYEPVIEDRVVNYCLYGPEDAIPVVSHNGSPSTHVPSDDVFGVLAGRSGGCWLSRRNVSDA